VNTVPSFTFRIPPAQMEAQRSVTPGGGLNEEGSPLAPHMVPDEESDSSLYKDIQELKSDETTEPEVLPSRSCCPIGN
jgi:hypothetical protein